MEMRKEQQTNKVLPVRGQNLWQVINILSAQVCCIKKTLKASEDLWTFTVDLIAFLYK